MSEYKPLSKNIGVYEAGDWTLTAASWEPTYGGISHEIGIRHKATGDFKLFQGDFGHQSVQEVCEAMALLLKASSGEKAALFFTPEWCMNHFN